jgi:hypothetical protein
MSSARSKYEDRAVIEALEPRLLLSSTIAGQLPDPGDDGATAVGDSAIMRQQFDQDSAAAAVPAPAEAAAATLQITVGSHQIVAGEANQVIPLYVTGGQMVQGLDFYIELGDGGAPNGGSDTIPIISNVDIVGPGTLFNQSNTGQFDTFASDLLWAVSTTTDAGVIDEIAADGLLAYVTIDAAGTSAGESYSLSLTGVAVGIFGPPGVDTGFAGVAADITNGVLEVVSSIEPVARNVFYNNSSLDGNDAAANAADDGAVDSSKTALLPGQAATPSNYTSYSRGINGVMVDIAGLSEVYDPVASDFGVRVSDTATGAWSSGPAPSVSVRRGEGFGGAARVTLIWPDGVIANKWVEVTVKSDANGGGLGLASDDLFYFGNSLGDSDGDGSVGDGDLDLFIDQFGLSGGGLASDFDGDGRVALSDFTIMRERFGQSVATPSFPAPAPVAAGAPAIESPLGVSAPIAPAVDALLVSPVSIEVGETALPSPDSAPSSEPTYELRLSDALENEGPIDPLDVSLETEDILVDLLSESVLRVSF